MKKRGEERWDRSEGAGLLKTDSFWEGVVKMH